jgi:hypothetical protein
MFFKCDYLVYYFQKREDLKGLSGGLRLDLYFLEILYFCLIVYFVLYFGYFFILHLYFVRKVKISRIL